MLGIAKAEQDAGGDVPRREAAPQQRQRRDPDAATDENRPSRRWRIAVAGWQTATAMQVAGGGEGVAEGAVDPDALAGPELAEAVGAGPDALDQEVEPDTAGRRPAL